MLVQNQPVCLLERSINRNVNKKKYTESVETPAKVRPNARGKRTRMTQMNDFQKSAIR